MTPSHRKDAASFDVFNDITQSSEDWQLASTLQKYNTSQQLPMTDVTSSNIVLNPPTSQNPLSPLKQTSPHSSPPIHINSASFDSVVLPPPEEYHGTDSPPKRDLYGPHFTQIAPRPQKVLFATFPVTNPSLDHEKRASLAIAIDSTKPAPQYHSGLTPVLGKRSLPDPLAARNRPIKKPRTEEEFDGPIPDPEDMPPVVDEGGKPPYSYSMMIGMAILRSPGRQMTLANIYKWILDTFKFYREAGPGWQNSIRHNLSLSKLFFKKERPKDDPGKGHYWAIQEGSEAQFVNNRTHRRPTVTENMYYAPYNEKLTAEEAKLGLPQLPTASFAIPPKLRRAAVDSSQFPCDSELSSDATVPASDHANDEKDEDPAVALPQPTRRSISAPPSPQMQSSPPVTLTPSRKHRFVSHSRSGSRARLKDTFKDSGFYSSIESSIPRGKPVGAPLQLTSDLDYDCLPQSSKLRARGRAEEEIARMRSSSFDPSPTKTTKNTASAVFKKPTRAAATSLDSSSPLRASQSDSHIGFPPLTPGITLLPPAIKPPPTISPGTHLRRHRESVRDLVGTPARGLLMAGSGVDSGEGGLQSRKWSPFAFHDSLELELSPLKGVENEFAILDDDSDLEGGPTVRHGSPIKRSLTSLDDHPSLAFEDAITTRSPARIRASTSTSPEKWSAFFASGSPVAPKSKSSSLVRSNNRPGLQRAQTSTGALADMSAGLDRGTTARLASPFRMPPPSTSLNSGSKGGELSPVKKSHFSTALKADAFWGADVDVESSGDELNDTHRQGAGGLDLTKGFKSIGSTRSAAGVGMGKENEPTVAAMGQRKNEKTGGGAGIKKSRPPLGRSSTNVW